MVLFGVLGPVRADTARGPVALKGPRHRAVLARLLIARGRVVPVDLLVDDLWERPPEGAVAAIRTFVSDLRRALEPDRLPRQPAALLVTAPPGYALTAAPDAVDAWRFEAAVTTPGTTPAAPSPGATLAAASPSATLTAASPGAMLAALSPGATLTGLDAALALWRGPAYAEYADQGWARAEIDRLDGLRLLAVERRAEALLTLGRAADAASDLQAHAMAHPLREDAWQLLATALYRAGRQGEALAALRQIRARLADELGVDPGPRLRHLETDILTQAPHLTPPHTPTSLSLDPAAPVPLNPPTSVPVPLNPATTASPDPAATPSSHPAATASIRPSNSAASGASHPLGSTVLSGPSPAADASCGKAAFRPGGTPELVGRDAELAQLLHAAAQVADQGRPALALISGEAGAGKTALVEELTRRLTAQGWTATWGHGPGYEGAAVTWPGAVPETGIPTAGPGGDQPTGRGSEAARGQTTRQDAGAAGSRVVGRAGEGAGSQAVEDPAVARFRRRQAAVARLGAPAGRGPVLLVADDLHLADEATLEVVAALAVEPVPVFVVGTFRATEIGPALTAALARFARVEPVRVYLGGLDVGASGALARTVAGFDLDLRTARWIQRRSGGNPFFVRELARLLAAEGGAALERVPAGVRDIIRHRLEQLPEPVRTVLRQAAVLGRDIDPDLLAALAGDEAAMLDALDAALRAGVLDEDGPGGQPRFSHVLFRDTIYADLSALRRGRWHAVAGEALERRPQRDVAALAHHFARAAGPGTADRAARYSAAAAEQAERESRPHEAARLWQQALTAHDKSAAGPDTGTPARPGSTAASDRPQSAAASDRPQSAAASDRPESAAARDRLAAVMGLGRALAITGHLDQARRHRAEALAAVRRLDDPGLTANVIAAFAVPAVWTRNDDEQLSAEIVRTAERALATLGPDRPEQRSRLLSTIALELRGTTTDRGDRAAREAEALARQTGDPALLAFALNARFMHTFGRTGLARERAAIGAELVGVAARHELVTFEVLGHLVLVQAHSALGEPADADAAAEAADRLAERYDLPLVGVLTQWYAALRLALDARTEEAEAAYRAAHLRLSASGMPGMADGLLGLALLSVAADGWPGADFGPYRPWAEPLILLAAGQRERAAAALRALPPSPHDLLREARLCLMVRAARTLGDEKTLARVREELRPAAGELAGAGSGAITLGRVSDYL